MNLLALLGGGKGKAETSPDDDADDLPSKGGSADAYAREAFSALKDDDEEGFVSALLALKSCGSASSEPDDDDAEV